MFKLSPIFYYLPRPVLKRVISVTGRSVIPGSKSDARFEEGRAKNGSFLSAPRPPGFAMQAPLNITPKSYLFKGDIPKPKSINCEQGFLDHSAAPYYDNKLNEGLLKLLQASLRQTLDKRLGELEEDLLKKIKTDLSQLFDPRQQKVPVKVLPCIDSNGNAPPKIQVIYNEFKTIVDQSMINYSTDIDSLFNDAVMVTTGGKTPSHVKLITGDLPVLCLPTRITWGDGTIVEYPKGLRNDPEGLQRFTDYYGVKVGEGAMLRSNRSDIVSLINASAKILSKDDLGMFLVASQIGSRSYKLLLALGFELPGGKSPGEIFSCEYIGGECKIKDETVKVPQILSTMKRPVAWTYLRITRQGIKGIAERSVQVDMILEALKTEEDIVSGLEK